MALSPLQLRARTLLAALAVSSAAQAADSTPASSSPTAEASSERNAESNAPSRSSEQLAEENAFGRTTTSLAPIDDPAEKTRGDGVYGRFNGPWSLSLAPVYEYQSKENVHRLGAEIAFRYLQAAGPYLRFRAPVSQGLNASSPLISLGAVFEPLFLLRWSRALEQGPSTLDLFVDSIGFHLGVAHRLPFEGDNGPRWGVETGLHCGVPLLGRANGLWLRARGSFLGGATGSAALVGLQLEWQFFLFDRKNR